MSKYGKYNCRALSEVERAWLAGIFDCDGHIGCFHRRSEHRSSPFFRPVCQIAQTKRALMDEVVRVVGAGRVYKHPNRPHYHVRLPDSVCRDFLAQIEPYLILKRRQAQLVIELCDRMHWQGRRLTEEERARRLAIQAELMELNKKLSGELYGTPLKLVQEEAG